MFYNIPDDSETLCRMSQHCKSGQTENACIAASLVIRIECKKNTVLTGYELINCILKCLHAIQFLFFVFFLSLKDKIICLLVRQSQYTVKNYRGLHKKHKNETLVKADSFDIRKEFLVIIMWGMGGGGRWEHHQNEKVIKALKHAG